MKTYAGPAPTHRLTVQAGKTFPRVAELGEIFFLEEDTVDNHDGKPWFAKGMYAFDGLSWERISGGYRARKSSKIGSRKIENEVALPFGTMPDQGGHLLEAVRVVPSNSRSVFSGALSMWLETSAAGCVTLAVFRGKKLVTFAAQYFDPKKPGTMALSFDDFPQERGPLSYSLRLYFSAVGNVFVNQSDRTAFDGLSSTAMIIEENT